MRIGIVGNGVVGNATGKAFEPHVDEVRYYDHITERRTHSVHDTLNTDLIFVCLPTPQKQGSLECDIGVITNFFAGRFQTADKNYVLRSTVPVGTTRMLREKYGLTQLVHSPEFLTARTAEEDAKNPTRLVIGYTGQPHCWDEKSCCITLMNLYEKVHGGLSGLCTPILTMTSDESEFVKLMQNSFSAIKIAAFNEFRCFSDKKGLDWERCLAALLAGGWINLMHTSVPGPDGKRGFGGSCLPKDLANMIQCMDDAGVQRLVSTAAYMRNEHIDRK